MTNLLAQREEGAFTTITDVEAFTATLKIVADWCDELECKLRRASLRFELCGLDTEEQEQLTQEVFAFASVCRVLSDTLGRSQ